MRRREKQKRKKKGKAVFFRSPQQKVLKGFLLAFFLLRACMNVDGQLFSLIFSRHFHIHELSSKRSNNRSNNYRSSNGRKKTHTNGVIEDKKFLKKRGEIACQNTRETILGLRTSV